MTPHQRLFEMLPQHTTVWSILLTEPASRGVTSVPSFGLLPRDVTCIGTSAASPGKSLDAGCIAELAVNNVLKRRYIAIT
jgi:hypothetical protein